MKKSVAAFVLIAALIVVPWAISIQYMKAAGALVVGKVVGKREAILLPGGDTWRHIFEITYEYRALDASYPETVVQRVDQAFYRTLNIGSPIRVRYSPSRVLRSFAGMGLYLEDASPLSRLRYGPPDKRDIVMAGALGMAFLIGLIAYASKSKVLGVIAAVIALTCFPAVLLAACAFVLFPALFWASRRNPGKGYGLALVATIALSIAVIYWRVPHASPLPPGSLRSGTGVVRQARTVEEIWSNAWETYGRTSGESIGHPFEMVDLEFTPEGASESIHVVDRVDRNSVRGLREDAAVPVEYSAIDPDSARIAGATRKYGQQNATYLLVLAYSVGALITFVFLPIKRVAGKLFRSSQAVRVFMDPGAAMTRINQVTRWSQLPEDDPRRKRLESLFGSRHWPPGKD